MHTQPSQAPRPHAVLIFAAAELARFTVDLSSKLDSLPLSGTLGQLEGALTTLLAAKENCQSIGRSCGIVAHNAEHTSIRGEKPDLVAQTFDQLLGKDSVLIDLHELLNFGLALGCSVATVRELRGFLRARYGDDNDKAERIAGRFSAASVIEAAVLNFRPPTS